MSAPHIACREGNVEQSYEGTDSHPVELCLVTGAVAHITINPPSGKPWPLPSAGPASIVKSTKSDRTGNALDITLVAQGKGTATLAVANMWQLKIAVV